jgi:hypothetical protein
MMGIAEGEARRLQAFDTYILVNFDAVRRNREPDHDFAG